MQFENWKWDLKPVDDKSSYNVTRICFQSIRKYREEIFIECVTEYKIIINKIEKNKQTLLVFTKYLRFYGIFLFVWFKEILKVLFYFPLTRCTR